MGAACLGAKAGLPVHPKAYPRTPRCKNLHSGFAVQTAAEQPTSAFRPHVLSGSCRGVRPHLKELEQLSMSSTPAAVDGAKAASPASAEFTPEALSEANKAVLESMSEPAIPPHPTRVGGAGCLPSDTDELRMTLEQLTKAPSEVQAIWDRFQARTESHSARKRISRIFGVRMWHPYLTSCSPTPDPRLVFFVADQV